jgi:hypothetical protein
VPVLLQWLAQANARVCGQQQHGKRLHGRCRAARAQRLLQRGAVVLQCVQQHEQQRLATCAQTALRITPLALRHRAQADRYQRLAQLAVLRRRVWRVR